MTLTKGISLEMNITHQDLISMLSNKRVLLPVNRFLSGEYPYHIASIAAVLQQNNGTLVLLDYKTPDFEIGACGSLRNVARENTIYSEMFYEELAKRYSSKVVSVNLAILEDKELIDLSKIDSLLAVKAINEELYHSIQSIWMSRNLITLRDRRLSRAEIKLLQSDVRRYLSTYQTMESYLKENTTDLVVVPNGRNPDQVAIKHSAINFHTDYVHFERCFRRAGKLFFQPFQTQDTKEMNKYFLKLLDSYSAEEIEKAKRWAKNWLAEQELSVTVNPFITFVNRDLEQEEESRGKGLVPLFTSSIDERFSNLGIDLNNWESQTQALVCMSKRIKSLGYSTITRIHPNTGWKSWRELIELVSVLKQENLSYILPWESVSSYVLLKDAPFVVTWGSTLALESTAQGIPTFNLGFSRFDELIDLELVSGEKVRNWVPNLAIKPSQEKSLLAIYVSRNFGLKLEGQDWVYSMISKIQIDQRISLKVKNFIKPYIDFLKALIFPLSRRPYDTYFILKRVFGKRIADGIVKLQLELLVSKHGLYE